MLSVAYGKLQFIQYMTSQYVPTACYLEATFNILGHFSMINSSCFSEPKTVIKTDYCEGLYNFKITHKSCINVIVNFKIIKFLKKVLI